MHPIHPPPRLAIVGFGRLARSCYLAALRELGHPGPVAVADPLDASRAAASAAIPGVRTYPDARALVDAEELDALLVSSPPSTHLEAWEIASAAGVGVFVEKPFLLSHQLAGFVPPGSGGPPLMVDFNRRFWRVYQRVAELVRSGRAGTIESATLWLHADVDRWSTVTSHRHLPEEGGALHDLGSHLLDLAWFILAREPSTVDARREGDDVRLKLRMDDGVTVECTVGYGRGNREQVEIRGSAGIIRVWNPNGVAHFERNGLRRPRVIDRMQDGAAMAIRGVLLGRPMIRDSVRAALGEFLASLAAGRAPSPGLGDALRNAAWLEAATRSLASGRPEAIVHRPAVSLHPQPAPAVT